ncbi:MAG TPA: alpha-1,4-glucan--maltose-1-phosphate maltosyltransferase [Polyangiaceae bacterium]|nr:alpha-1,4-glucan--maltose-1-phosphate maltosyltransferase [Polyangiaceae bacterium]
MPHDGRSRVIIDAVEPSIDGGYAAKRIVRERVTISADLISDGHDAVAGELLLRRPAAQGEVRPAGAQPFDRAIPLEPLGNDRFAASFVPDAVGRWQYSIRAWVDHFASFRRGLARKVEAGQEVAIDLLVGAELVASAAARATGDDRAALQSAAFALGDRSAPAHERSVRATSPELAALMARHPDTSHASLSPSWLALWVDRERARFSAWYEMFPRSTGERGKHGTFATAAERLPYIAAMGFDVLYLPPIHPIGHTFRKGKNNQPSAGPDDVGSPWAIGSEEGGHKSIHPELGTLDDFDEFRAQASRHGLELALDVALQVTPDHPYVKEHPEWFKRRPDGTIQYAENPPKKYQDIYPFDFECEDWQGLWLELKSIFEFWMARGVRIFRVDNPHTKSLPFWRWCIAELTAREPDTLFLAEAFTRPKLMYSLAKAGFTQSYTYFTWRHTGRELAEYVREITTPPVSDFFRPNFWPNTPDILPEHLQHAGRSAFALRLVLAATLSSNYGVYGPVYELMENQPRAGVEEYVDNEKYELRSWDIQRQDSLRALMARINQIRKENAALQHNLVTFHPCDNELLLCFSKRDPDGENSVLVIANMDVHHAQVGWVDLDLPDLLARPPGAATHAATSAQQPAHHQQQPVQLHDLLSDSRYFSEGRRLYVRLEPGAAPAHIFRLRRRARSEHDFDYFV